MSGLEILVVGGGIAGVAAAAPLAVDNIVTLIDKETSLAFHTTGRSAALLFDTYGALPLWPLTRASRHYFEDLLPAVMGHPMLSNRGALTVGFSGEETALDQMFEASAVTGVDVARLSGDEARDVCPVLAEHVVGAVFERDAADMDVAAIHQAFVRLIIERRGTVRVGVELTQATGGAHGGQVTLSDGSSWRGDVVVNASGAWGDVVAARCGIEPVGLEPRRRTAFMVTGTPDSEAWPLVVDRTHTFYFKPDGQQLLCSPADETLEEPKDARPEELDVAIAIERINEATTLAIRSVRSQWAGQRTFVADRSMVIGPDPSNNAFVWLVGQGGTGIQTAPAAGELAAALATGTAPPNHLVAAGLDLAGLTPDRLR